MSRYSFQDSIKDGATLKLEFEPVPVELHIDRAALDAEFDALTDQISQEDKVMLVKKTNTEALFTSPDRIRKVCEHIVAHFRENIEPTGLKAQVVVYNRGDDHINGRQFYTLSIEQDGSRNFETFDYSLRTEPVQPTQDYVSRAEFQGLVDRINQMTTGGTDGIPQPVQEAAAGATG